jgi:hypothetical protein
MNNPIEKITIAIVITDKLVFIGEIRSRIVRSAIDGTRVTMKNISCLFSIESAVTFVITFITKYAPISPKKTITNWLNARILPNIRLTPMNIIRKKIAKVGILNLLLSGIGITIVLFLSS